MRVSIVVPAFNEERRLAASLGAIGRARQAFDDRGWSSELIVCDNGSTDGTAGIAAACGARLVFERRRQIGGARNAGAARAGGDWLLFVDADSWPTPELFADVADAIEGGRCLAGGSTLRLSGGGTIGALLARSCNLLIRLTRWAPGAFIFCERAAFQRAGGFSKDLFAAEEVDLFRRLKKLARRQDRTIEILHQHPLETSGRKLELYGWRDPLHFIARVIVSRGRVLTSAEQCFLWYDGRR